MAKYILQKDAVECAQNEGAFDVALWLEDMETVELPDNTTDVQPVKRGKWEMNSNYPDRPIYYPSKLICSNCKSTYDVYFYEKDSMNYCPNCGAYMRGED